MQAHKWFNLGATSGDADALKNRDIVASKMTPAQIADAQRLLAHGGRSDPTSKIVCRRKRGFPAPHFLLGRLIPTCTFIAAVYDAMPAVVVASGDELKH